MRSGPSLDGRKGLGGGFWFESFFSGLALHEFDDVRLDIGAGHSEGEEVIFYVGGHAVPLQ